MWMRLALSAAMIAAGAGGVAGQTTTADGVAALARGDYERAVAILKPIAEDWRSDDVAAQFFMAGLYETGRGVPADALRACALYQRATSKPENPFGRAAMTLFTTAWAARGVQFNQECQQLANLGFDNGFEPATFDLGPGHSVEWTLTGASVTYKGQTKRQDMAYAMPGARFLPLQHTELRTGPARALTRHFIAAFVWQPSGQSGGWDLWWHVFEVVGRELVRIETPNPVFSLAGAEPPFKQTFDASEYAVVRVDDGGNAEWAVLKGSIVAAERIESEAERREVRDAERARDAAMSRVDWDTRLDVNRPPSLAYVDADGCGLLHVYGWTADRAEAIVVGVRLPEHGPSTPSATFDIARDSASVAVEAHVYEAPQLRFDFCSDVRILPAPGSIQPEAWRAVAGTIAIDLSDPGIRARQPWARRATITLNGVVLRNAAGLTVRGPRTVKLTAIVGSMW